MPLHSFLRDRPSATAVSPTRYGSPAITCIPAGSGQATAWGSCAGTRPSSLSAISRSPLCRLWSCRSTRRSPSERSATWPRIRACGHCSPKRAWSWMRRSNSCRYPRRSPRRKLLPLSPRRSTRISTRTMSASSSILPAPRVFPRAPCSRTATSSATRSRSSKSSA